MSRFSRRIPPRGHPHGATLDVAVCDDPETSMQLMGVRGRLDQTTIASLAVGFSEIPDGVALHLDFTDVVVADPGVMPHLERLVDHLEERRIRLRVVGFDPGHSSVADDRMRS